EREKRKVEAAKKRAELEREERKERSRVGTKATQRARDRFGFRGSQSCLGAWFGDQRKVEQGKGGELEGGGMDGEVWDETDEEDLMEGVEEPGVSDHGLRTTEIITAKLDQEAVPERLPPKMTRGGGAHSIATPYEAQRQDSVLDDEWDDELLADYIPTQCAQKATDVISRAVEKSSPPKAPEPRQPSLTTSFGSIDLTEEDLDALDATVLASSPIKAVIERPRIMMPLPALPSRTSRPDPQRGKAKMLSRSVSLPMPARHSEAGMGSRLSSFTLTQLESFVEEDLQLTQV
ncbi:hypothetical protein LTR95_018973, partial [Oleoguttula sp. CCFEE 5521]